MRHIIRPILALLEEKPTDMTIIVDSSNISYHRKSNRKLPQNVFFFCFELLLQNISETPCHLIAKNIRLLTHCMMFYNWFLSQVS